MEEKPKKIKYLVADTAVFIKQKNVEALAEHVVTIAEVVDEIKNKNQLRRLATLPYELQVKDVFPEYVKFVTNFAIKTGDYRSLSATDIKMIALTYQLEKEHVGIDHLKTEPAHSRTLNVTTRSPQVVKDIMKENLPGFYYPKSKKAGSENEDNVETEDFAIEMQNLELRDDENDIENSDAEGVSEEDVENADQFSEPDINEDDILQVVKKENEDLNEDSNTENESCEEEEEDSDSGEWITPSNFKEKCKQVNAECLEDKLVTVACMTTDFAMQNVLKQIGLNVSSLDGLMIKQVRTFIFRCYACYRTTSIMTKLFCPSCGHKTLKKVAVSIDDTGKQVIHLNLRKPVSARGKAFSLPTPRGGQHSNYPILTEDQPVPQQNASRVNKMKTNALHEDYIAQQSPFVMHDLTSRSSVLGIRGRNKEMQYWMKRNPNESRKKRK